MVDPTTPPSPDAAPSGTAILPLNDKPDVAFLLGPAVADGHIIESAQPEIGQGGTWTVRLRLKAGADGIDRFNQAAQACAPPSASCPAGQLAIVVDGRVVSAPTIQPGSSFTPFQRDAVSIFVGPDEQQARALAARIDP